MYEQRTDPLLPPGGFVRRFLRHAAVASAILMISLGIGMLGYRSFEGMNWLDAFLNAAMILGGMGPVAQLQTAGGKLFAGLYALFSGLIVLVIAGVVFAPLAHRLLHRFHADPED